MPVNEDAIRRLTMAVGALVDEFNQQNNDGRDVVVVAFNVIGYTPAGMAVVHTNYYQRADPSDDSVVKLTRTWHEWVDEFVADVPDGESIEAEPPKPNPNTWNGPRPRAELVDLGYVFDQAERWSPCRTCGTQITWVTTPKGRRMPLEQVGCRDDEMFEVHFAKCPGAGTHRRKQ